MNDILVNGNDIDICELGFCKAIFSSGTSVIGASKRIIEKILEKVNIDGNCKGVEKAPSL